MITNHRIRAAALAGVAGLALLCTSPGMAQGAGRHNFNVPAGSLSDAVAAFTAQSGIRVSITAPDAAVAHVNGIAGTYADQEAFARMLAGSGLSWHAAGNTIVVDGMVMQAPAGDHVLGAVQVEGADSGFTDVTGFGAGAGANGSSDSTATEGTRSLTTNGTSVATKVATSIKNTPQTVAVITSEQIKQQNLTSVYSALQSTPGITLVNTSGNGGLANNVILSRGFTVDTFVIDGGAAMNYQIRGGQTVPDLSEYDHVEILKGSDALFGGASDPGGVVSLQRKRPLDHDQLALLGHIGNWTDGRAEVDATGPIALDGHLKARVDVSYQNQNFFYRYAHQNTLHLYGILEGDIGTKTVIRVGGSYQKLDSRGDNAFGLPRYLSGGDLHLPRSTNFSEPWAYTHSNNGEEFVQLDHKFDQDWQFNSSVTRTTQSTKALEAYFQGPINADGSNLQYEGPRYSDLYTRQLSADAHLSGGFQMFGRTQKILVGVDYQESVFNYHSPSLFLYPTVNVFAPNLAQFSADPGIPDPITAPSGGQVYTLRSKDHQWGIYASLFLEPVKNLHLSGGFRYSNYYNSAFSANALYFSFLPGVPLGYFPTVTSDSFKNIVTPSASAVYELSKTLSLYFSYADIYKQNGTYVTTTGSLLPPERGVTIEGGIKAVSASGKLNASLAGFSVKQNNVPIQASYASATTAGFCCYAPNAGQTNTGIELQVAGEVAKGWQLNGGYTYLHQAYNAAYLSLYTSGLPYTSSQQPQHQVKLWSAYSPDWEQRFTFLTGFRLDSVRYTSGSVCTVATLLPYCPIRTVPFKFNQPLYAIADLGLEFRPDKHVVLGLNVTNVTDKRYYATAGTNQYLNFYGEPRKVLFSVRTTY